MPIRMVDDNQNDSYRPDNGGNNINIGGGGNGCLFMFLPILMNLFKRNPKLALLLIVAGLIFYFVSNSNLSGGGETDNSALSKGCDMKQEIFDKAEVFAGLDPTKNRLPSRVTLEKYAPSRRNQGEQGSCVAWASAYAARTIMESASTGVAPNQTAFSPAYMYNQIHLPNCQGAYIDKAMELMKRQGNVPFQSFPYNPGSCSKEPPASLLSDAAQYRIRGYNRLTVDGHRYELDMEAIKQNLAKGAPVVIGMMVGGSFMEGMFGQDVWNPTRRDYSMSGFGGHAMCVIGYDDNYQGGAFQIMNSWGPEWGNNGIGWIRYSDFMKFTKEAYGLDPLPKRGTSDQSKFSVSLGLVTNNSSQYIPLKVAGNNTFSSATIAKGTKFKMEITNNIECYIYVFGQETDNSSYVLFPYSAKHSPFCGITGTRLFPKTESMMADNEGTKDYIAVVISKSELDYNALNTAINNNKQSSYAARLFAVLGANQVRNVNFRSSETIQFESAANDKSVIGMVVEINKR